MRHCLILGANSAIARETIKLFAKDGDELLLVARKSDNLESLKADLTTRGATKVASICCDLADTTQHEKLLDNVYESMPELDTVLVAYGTLGNQKACEADFKLAYQELNTNFISVVSLLTPLANKFAEKKEGTIAVISSVAGDKGRQSNYIYGTAKGALSIFLEGLRNRLYGVGVNVITIKPGFVDTPMTKDVKKNALFASPQKIAKGIYNAIDKKRDVVYLPFYWFFIMFIIRLVPDFIFKRQHTI